MTGKARPHILNDEGVRLWAVPTDHRVVTWGAKAASLALLMLALLCAGGCGLWQLFS